MNMIGHVCDYDCCCYHVYCDVCVCVLNLCSLCDCVVCESCMVGCMLLYVDLCVCNNVCWRVDAVLMEPYCVVTCVS